MLDVYAPCCQIGKVSPDVGVPRRSVPRRSPTFHGSTRQLVDATGAVIDSGTAQVFAYDAYGIPVGFTLANALTALLYSGELTDQLTGLQYLRARYYNPATGTFNRLDPFAGNLSDPQSLHKYLYCHADAVNGIDPSGLMAGFSLSGMLTVAGINGGLAAISTGAYGAAKGWSTTRIATASLVSAGTAVLATFAFFGVAASFVLGGASAATAVLATTLIALPTSLGLVVMNFALAMKEGDNVDKLFATIDLGLAFIGLLSLRGVTGQQRAIAEAHTERLLAIRDRRPRGVAGAMSDGDFVVRGRSKKAQRPRRELDPKVEEIYDSVDEILVDYHKKCAEGDAASQADALEDLAGAWSAAVNIGGPEAGQLRQACPSCTHLLRELGVRDAFNPDYTPLYLIVASLFGEREDD